MGFHEHPFLFLYLAGCVLVAILILLKAVLFRLVAWMTKANVTSKNLKKIVPPDKRTLHEKAAVFFGMFGVEVALSWINVAVLLWQIATGLLQTLRELFSSTPEAIKVLRFPLRNNPDMPRESVWAYLQALQIKAGGKQPNESDLRSSVDELLGHYPAFDRTAALKQLMALNILSPDVVSTALDRLSSDPAPMVSSDGDEPYTVDDEPWEDGGSWTHLYPSQRKFMRHAWWIPGDSEEHYDYRVDPDGRIMCRLYLATETGTKSGDAPFEERFYQDRPIVKDGVVVEDALRFIREGRLHTNLTEEIAELTAKTEWHELTLRSSGWPELWFHIIKFHVGEYEARHGVREELERLKRAVRTITERTRQWFTIEHHENYLYSDFKPLDESSSKESLDTILSEALSESGISLGDAQGAHFQIRRLSALVDDAKEESKEEPERA